jgi:hypothetical protein
MPAHSELDQLSAYIDGELDAVERAQVDAHLPSCAECRTTLDALRATLTDLAMLPEPAPSEQDSWAIRSAISRSRAPAKRWQRAAWAVGTVAAGVVAFVAFTQGTSSNNGGTLDALSKGRNTASENVAVNTVAGDFDPLSAQSRLLFVSNKVRDAAMPEPYAAVEGTPDQQAAPASGGAAFQAFALSREKVPTAAIARCVAAVTRSATEALTPLQYELVTFEKKPAFFLFFSTAERVELWVVTRDRCEVLYFGQTA